MKPIMKALRISWFLLASSLGCCTWPVSLAAQTSPALTGDRIATSDGDLVIHPLNHATLVLGWNGKTIYCDPTGAASYTGLPKADLVLVTHVHGDHFNKAAIDAVSGAKVLIIAPQAVFNGLTAEQKRAASVLPNGSSTNVLGLKIEAVPAYNGFHPKGAGNGYVLTLGGKRIYISGDTGATPEMRQLQSIDVAFVCMNQPYTMTVTDAVAAVAAFRPKIVYPYHYRDQGGSTANAAQFKEHLDPALGIEVRLRKWY
jgi:L-ascorbate metabolism protein UlaG (beta-lactamase superfamily)